MKPLAKYYQVLHLDYSEYGIDDYFEFDCTPNATTYQENKDCMNSQWLVFTSVMGGKIVRLDATAMMSLIDEAIPIAESTQYREFDNEENVQFRRDALVRIRLMKEALETEKILNDDYTYEQIMAMVIPKRLTACETINYFLMRLVDRDFKAAVYLSTIPEDELRENVLASPGIQTLMRNKINKSSVEEDVPSDGKSSPYRCKAMTLAERGYYYSCFVIYLDGDYTARDSKVTEISVGSMDKMSEYEAALQHSQREYITVFDCRDRILDGFDGDKISVLERVVPHQVPNGWLWTVYNKDNSHVNKSDYRISDDVYGYALLSIDGEFVLMSNKLMNIANMEEATMISMYRPFMRLDGRYTLETPIYHTLCNTYGIMFRALIDQPEYSK